MSWIKLDALGSRVNLDRIVQIKVVEISGPAWSVQLVPDSGSAFVYGTSHTSAALAEAAVIELLTDA